MLTSSQSSARLSVITLALLTSLICLFMNIESVSATTIDPDDFPAGTVLNEAFPGVKLSPAFADGTTRGTDNVLAFTSLSASTGSRVFGRQISGFVPDQNWFDPGRFTGVISLFRADFERPASLVSIDIINTGGGQAGLLFALNSAGQVITESLVDVSSPGSVARASVFSASDDIAYILAGGVSQSTTPPFPVVALDRLEYSSAPAPVPAPATIFLLVSSFLIMKISRTSGILRMRKRSKLDV